VLLVYMCRRHVTGLIHSAAAGADASCIYLESFLLLSSLYHRIHAYGSPQLPYRNIIRLILRQEKSSFDISCDIDMNTISISS